MSIKGRLLEIAYKLNRHHWGDLPLTVVVVGTLLLLAGGIQLFWVEARPWVPLLLVLGALGLTTVALVGRFVGYVRFKPDKAPPPSAPAVPLVPTDKIPHRATGRFEVEGKRRYLVEVQAWFRTFETREHAVMAYRQPSRLFPGEWPAHEVGMWYIFFQPEHIRAVETGQVLFGPTPRLGLRITYRSGERMETVLLSFDSEEERQRVLADLLRDAAGSAPETRA